MRGHRPQFFAVSCRALLQESNWQSLVKKYGTVSAVSTAPTPQSAVFERAVKATAPRNNWKKEEIKEIYDTPLMKLAFAAVRLSEFKVVSIC
jgi:biotin synthase